MAGRGRARRWTRRAERARKRRRRGPPGFARGNAVKKPPAPPVPRLARLSFAIASLLKDLDLKAEDVPLLAGETVHADQQGTCAGFNKIMAELPKTLPNSHVISSASCTSNDRLHFNPAGSREFGKRYGEKMLSVMGVQVAKPK